MNYINVDNNYYNLSIFPVMLTTKRSLKKMKKDYFFNFHLVRNNNESEFLKDIELFELEMRPLVITTEYILISALLSLKEQID